MQEVTIQDCVDKDENGEFAIINDGRVLGFTMKLPQPAATSQGLNKFINSILSQWKERCNGFLQRVS